MIISKPKAGTLFAVGVFLLLAYGVSAYLIYEVVQAQAFATYQILLLPLTLGIALGVTIKVIIDHKTIVVDKDRVDVKFLLPIHKRYYLKNLEFWQETKIKTFSSAFKELTMRFDNRKSVRLSTQENTNYERVQRYLKKKYPRKEQKQT
jgi:hypothetical protein